VIVAVLVLAISVVGTGWLPDAIESRVQDSGSYIGGLDPSSTEVTDENFSVLERLAHWRAGWSMFEDRPWLGVGIGNYAASYSRYALPYWYEPLGHAHNVFVNFLAETGILGLGAFLGFWLAVVWTAARYAWCGGQSWGMALAFGLVGTWTYLVVHSLFDNLFVGHMQLQLALLLAALAAMRQFPSSSRTWQG
jgi:putative inorganic carbon (HCO3(-)) transporter